MVTVKPVSPAHCLYCASSSFFGTRCTQFSTALSSSMFHVLPMENVVFAFSRALCRRTRPVERTETMMARAFLFAGFPFGGGGVWGEAASS